MDEKKYTYKLIVSVDADNSKEALTKIFTYVKENDAEDIFDVSNYPANVTGKIKFTFKMNVSTNAEDPDTALAKIVKYVKDHDIEELIEFKDLSNNDVEVTLTDTEEIDPDDYSVSLSVMLEDVIESEKDDKLIGAMNPPEEIDEDDVIEEE